MTRNVLDWLEASEKTSPDRAAFTDPAKSLSFSEFAAAARKGGSFTASKAPQRTPVLICMEKSVEAAVAMFSAVYAGCFYSFMEANQPAARVRRIIETLGPSVIIADDPAYFADLADDVPVFSFGALKEATEDSALLAERRSLSMDTDPLYVNLTSGITGVPMGD